MSSKAFNEAGKDILTMRRNRVRSWLESTEVTEKIFSGLKDSLDENIRTHGDQATGQRQFVSAYEKLMKALITANLEFENDESLKIALAEACARGIEPREWHYVHAAGFDVDVMMEMFDLHSRDLGRDLTKQDFARLLIALLPLTYLGSDGRSEGGRIEYNRALKSYERRIGKRFELIHQADKAAAAYNQSLIILRARHDDEGIYRSLLQAEARNRQISTKEMEEKIDKFGKKYDTQPGFDRESGVFLATDTRAEREAMVRNLRAQNTQDGAQVVRREYNAD